MNLFFLYIAIINIIGFVMVIYDKNNAKMGKWRIQEYKFFLTALLGGSLGVYISMKLVRHKTLHLKFSIGIPLIMILNFIVLYRIYIIL